MHHFSSKIRVSCDGGMRDPEVGRSSRVSLSLSLSLFYYPYKRQPRFLDVPLTRRHELQFMGPMRRSFLMLENIQGYSLYPEQLRVVKTRITRRIAWRSLRFFIPRTQEGRLAFFENYRKRIANFESRISISNDRTKSASRGSILARWIIRTVPRHKSHLGHDFTGEINHTAHTSFGGRGGE